MFELETWPADVLDRYVRSARALAGPGMTLTSAQFADLSTLAGTVDLTTWSPPELQGFMQQVLKVAGLAVAARPAPIYTNKYPRPQTGHGFDEGSDNTLVWIRCEMTGLDLINDALIEVAAVVTDGELNVLGDGVDVVIKPSDEALAQMGDFERNMHQSSGLLDVLADGMSMQDAEERVLDYIREHVPEGRKAPLAGNTIGTDRAFLARDMPTLESHVHYRNVDVSSLEELARRWFPRVYFHSPVKSENHPAAVDALESIEELRYYREALFVAPPGPDSPTCKEIAAKFQATLTSTAGPIGSKPAHHLR